MDLPDTNSMTSFAQLVSSLMIAPAVLALRKIVKRHDAQLDEHDDRLTDLEVRSPKKRARRK